MAGMEQNPYESPKEHPYAATEAETPLPTDLNGVILLALASSAALALLVVAVTRLLQLAATGY